MFSFPGHPCPHDSYRAKHIGNERKQPLESHEIHKLIVCTLYKWGRIETRNPKIKINIKEASLQKSGYPFQPGAVGQKQIKTGKVGILYMSSNGVPFWAH